MVDSTAEISSLIKKVENLYRAGKQDEVDIENARLKELAIVQKDEKASLIAKYNDTYRLYDEQDFDAVKTIIEEIIPGFKQLNMDLYLLKSYNTLAIVASEKASYYEGIRFYLEAYRIAKNHVDFRYSCIILVNIGNLLIWLKEYESALDYLIQGYEMYKIENVNNENILATTVIDIIDAYSMLDRFEEAEEWVKTPIKIDEQNQLIIDNIFLTNEMKKSFLRNDKELVIKNLPKILENIKKSSNYIYQFRIALRILDICIELKNQSACKEILLVMDEKKAENNIDTFTYDYAKIKVKYLQCFDIDKSNTRVYLDEYYKESQKVINQLNQTYTTNLMVQLELDKARDDREQVITMNTELEKNLQYDSFTQLYNKVTFRHFVEQKLNSIKDGIKQALIILDIDYFKMVNDKYGHDVGDVVLIKLASLLQRLSTDSILAGRFGGDEFILYLYDYKHDQVLHDFIDNLLNAGREIIIPQSNNQHITLSIGAVSSHSRDFEKLFSKADQALYECKNRGRNQYNICID